MNWTAISTIIDMVGAVFLVVSLWYVAVQIRQNTKATLASSRQGLIDSEMGLLSDYINYALDPHFIGDDVKLSPDDERRLTWILIKILRLREFIWHQYKSGSLDEESWESYMAPVPAIFATERAKAVLRFYVGSPGFMQMLADRITAAGTPPPPLQAAMRMPD